MKFLKVLLTMIHMYRLGFFFSDNTHIGSDGSYWGFFRFNHKKVPAMYDIDFDFNGKGKGYFHLHGGDYRVNFENGTFKVISK